MPEQKQRQVQCPSCGKSVAWIDSNKYRPFCSERCQLIDFGEWATEKHAIAGEPAFPPEEDPDGGLQ
jgi:hypothetical protein